MKHFVNLAAAIKMAQHEIEALEQEVVDIQLMLKARTAHFNLAMSMMTPDQKALFDKKLKALRFDDLPKKDQSILFEWPFIRLGSISDHWTDIIASNMAAQKKIEAIKSLRTAIPEFPLQPARAIIEHFYPAGLTDPIKAATEFTEAVKIIKRI